MVSGASVKPPVSARLVCVVNANKTHFMSPDGVLAYHLKNGFFDCRMVTDYTLLQVSVSHLHSCHYGHQCLMMG